MQCGTTVRSSGGGHIPPSSLQANSAFSVEEQQQPAEEEQSTEEALVVAMGNAAKAARRASVQEQQRLRTTAAEASEKPETTDDDRHPNVVGDTERNTTTAYYYHDTDDGEECYTTAAIPSAMSSEKKNEIYTLSDGYTIRATTTTTTTTNDDDDDGGAVVVDDEDDYVVGNYGEEEVRAYKTSGAATLSQSEHIVQQQQQQQQGFNALVSNVGLFLDQTWNWLHYFLVTIIFLNFVNFANRRKSVVGEDRSVVGSVEGVNIEEEKRVEQDKNPSLESEEESGNKSTNNCTSVINENNSTLLENIICEQEITMSPNTCSIQNQEEVEKAEEAIMAVGTATSEEKTEAAVAAPVATAKPEENESENKQQQITIVLPSTEQVVVVSGDEASSSSSEDNTSENKGLVGIRRDSVDSYTSSEGSGNLGDIEGEICDKSSEDGLSTTSGTADDDGSTGKQIAQKIISQVESMFSDEHLAKDGFLLKHVRRRSDGFVSLKLVAGLRKVKQISREFPVVLDALKDSSKLEINAEGTKVRRVEPLTSFLKSVPIKSKDKEKESKGGSKDCSSNEENSLPSATATIHQNNKSPSKTGNKENNNNENGNKGAGSQSRRNSNANNNGSNSRRNSNANHRKSSNTSTTSSNNSSRHNSFSKAPTATSQHPADLFRNVYMAAYSSSGEENQSPQVGRRRGGSLPIAALHRASLNGAYLSPNSSPPNGTLIIGPNGARPKSNSYCEGASPTTMSPWLQRRKASASSRLSNGELTFSGIIRQPRGPDGTKGFATGYRAMILEERLEQQQNSAVSA